MSSSDPKYQPMNEDHRYPRLNMTRLASGLDVYYVPDEKAARLVLATLRTVNPRGRFACEYPTKNGEIILLLN